MLVYHSYKHHIEKCRFDSERLRVVYNGLDTSVHSPDLVLRVLTVRSTDDLLPNVSSAWELLGLCQECRSTSPAETSESCAVDVADGDCWRSKITINYIIGPTRSPR